LVWQSKAAIPTVATIAFVMKLRDEFRVVRINRIHHRRENIIAKSKRPRGRRVAAGSQNVWLETLSFTLAADRLAGLD